MAYKITATQISDFFKGRQSQELLPELVRRLVFAQSIPSQLKRCRFPSGEKITERGFDGYVSFEDGNYWVPAGKSLWEVGTNSNPEAKANADWGAFPKRKWPKTTARMNYSWIFVTPHFWPEQDRQTWIEEKNAEGHWKEVKAYDATDLETWLEQCPGVNRWLSREMGHSCHGMMTAEEFLDNFLPEYKNREAKSKLIIAGRESEKEQFIKWLRTGGQRLLILGESRQEGALFAAAAIFNTMQSFLFRTIFVDNPKAVSISQSAIGEVILVPLTEDAEKAALASENKSCRIVRQGINRPISLANTASLQLKLENGHANPVENALSQLGFSEKYARQIAKEAKGSLNAVTWAFGGHVESVKPDWAGGNNLSLYAALWLAGQWDESNSNDCGLLETLSGKTWADIESAAAANIGFCGQFERFGKMIDWKAWPTCINYVFPAFSGNLLTKYKECLLAVLTQTDPKVQMPPEDRWLAGIKKICHPYSSFIRQGLISALVKMAVTFPNENRIVSLISSTIREVLINAQGKPLGERWASLAGWLGDLAEASPDIFLDAAEKLVKDDEACPVLFVKTDNFLFNSSYHCNLLWALERLAWNSDYLSRVVDILALLEEKKWESSISNTALGALYDIFLPWRPHTTASVDARQEIFKSLANNHPEVAWKLACEIKPSNHGSTSGTDKPKWHDWLESYTDTVTNKEYFEFSEFIMNWMIEQAANKLIYWNELIDSYTDWKNRCFPETIEKFKAALFTVSQNNIELDIRKSIYESLRSFVAKHHKFSECGWALPEKELKPFETLVENFAPQDLLLKYDWLFANWPNFATPRKMSYSEREEFLNKKRFEAIKEILSQHELHDIFEVITKNSDKAHPFGISLAGIDLSPDKQKQILQFGVDASKTEKNIYISKLSFLKGYVSQYLLLVDNKEKWISEVFDSNPDWDNNMRVNFALALHANGDTWKLVDSWGDDAKTYYWKEVSHIYLRNPERDLQKAVSEFSAVLRPCEAINIIAYALDKTKALSIDDDLIVQVIQQAPLKGMDTENRDLGMTIYHVDELLEYLEGRGIGDEKIASLEWLWLSALERANRGIKSLKNCLSSDPKFFVEVLQLVFRPKNEEEKELNEAAQQRVERGFNLLQYWDTTPGVTYTDTPQKKKTAEENNSAYIHFRPGIVDYDKLLNYCNEARKLSKESGRLSGCDSRLGHIMAYSPLGEDGNWPNEDVCKVIEEIASSELDRGIHSEVNNKRGCYTPMPGGRGELLIAAQFKKYAESRQKYKHVVNILNGLAHDYEIQAKDQQDRERYQEFY